MAVRGEELTDAPGGDTRKEAETSATLTAARQSVAGYIDGFYNLR